MSFSLTFHMQTKNLGVFRQSACLVKASHFSVIEDAHCLFRKVWKVLIVGGVYRGAYSEITDLDSQSVNST